MQRAWFKILLMVSVIGVVTSVQEASGDGQGQPDKQLQPSEDIFSSKLTGDWYGRRIKLAENGITFNIDVVQTFQGILDGGLQSDPKYGGSLDYWVNFDLGKMGLWPGAFVELRAESLFGESINFDTGSIIATNTDGFFPLPDEHMTTLSSVVFTQFLSENLAIFFGKIDTLGGDNNRFAGGRGKVNFMNQNFILNPVTLRVVPYSSLGGGLAIFFPDAAGKNPATLSFTFIGADGQPDTAGWDDDFENGSVYAIEYVQPTRFFDLPGQQLFGAAYSSKDFTALDQNRRTILLSLLGFGTLPKDEDSWCGYYNFHQYLVTEEDDETQGFGLFGRFGIADDQTSPIEAFYSIGLGGKGIFDGRDNDTYGVGYYYMKLSSVHVTPDLQILNPARSNLSTTIIAGCRVKIDF